MPLKRRQPDFFEPGIEDVQYDIVLRPYDAHLGDAQCEIDSDDDVPLMTKYIEGSRKRICRVAGMKGGVHIDEVGISDDDSEYLADMFETMSVDEDGGVGLGEPMDWSYPEAASGSGFYQPSRNGYYPQPGSGTQQASEAASGTGFYQPSGAEYRPEFNQPWRSSYHPARDSDSQQAYGAASEPRRQPLDNGYHPATSPEIQSAQGTAPGAGFRRPPSDGYSPELYQPSYNGHQQRPGPESQPAHGAAREPGPISSSDRYSQEFQQFSGNVDPEQPAHGVAPEPGSTSPTDGYSPELWRFSSNAYDPGQPAYERASEQHYQPRGGYHLKILESRPGHGAAPGSGPAVSSDRYLPEFRQLSSNAYDAEQPAHERASEPHHQPPGDGYYPGSPELEHARAAPGPRYHNPPSDEHEPEFEQFSSNAYHPEQFAHERASEPQHQPPDDDYYPGSPELEPARAAPGSGYHNSPIDGYDPEYQQFSSNAYDPEQPAYERALEPHHQPSGDGYCPGSPELEPARAAPGSGYHNSPIGGYDPEFHRPSNTGHHPEPGRQPESHFKPHAETGYHPERYAHPNVNSHGHPEHPPNRYQHGQHQSAPHPHPEPKSSGAFTGVFEDMLRFFLMGAGGAAGPVLRKLAETSSLLVNLLKSINRHLFSLVQLSRCNSGMGTFPDMFEFVQ